MVVVVIIAILATVSVPLFVQRIRERAVTQAAMTMGDLFRGARTRAMARGAAIMVTTRNDGSITVLEGVEGQAAAVAAGRASCGNLPVRGCTTNNWGNVQALPAIGNARVVGGVTASTDFTTTVTLGAAPLSPVHVCFSPGGRTFVNQVGVWSPAAWTPLTTVLTISVTSSGGRTRNVVVLPNGTARLGL
jgi:type II secretory pathway pseudopilin PulG